MNPQTTSGSEGIFSGRQQRQGLPLSVNVEHIQIQFTAQVNLAFVYAALGPYHSGLRLRAPRSAARPHSLNDCVASG